MPKLFVINPDGSNGVLSVADTGSYYDQSKVLWDERVSGDIPDEMLASNASSELVGIKSESITEIDRINDDIVISVIGRRDTEYLMAEQQAQAYIDSGYKGDTFPYVDGWAKAKNLDQKWAADNIIETATTWRTIQADIRANRLKTKESIRNAATADEIADIIQSWYAYIKEIKTQLGI